MHTCSIPRIIISLTPLVIALALAMDIYIPAVPTIAHQLALTTAQIQLTLNLFMIICGCVQLFFGPLTDSFSRRSVTAFVITIFTMGSLLCACANSLNTLLLGRIFQATGSCGMLVLGFAIARDICDDHRLAKVYSFLNGAIAISPLFGPFIGSYLDVRFGWRTTFISLLLVSGLAYGLYFTLIRESWPADKHITISSSLFSQYRRIFTHSSFLIYTAASAFGLSYLFIFCAISPVLIITLLHVPELQYGFYFCFMGISLLVGSLLCGVVVDKLGIFKTICCGFGITLLGGTIMLACFVFFGLTLYGFVLPMVMVGIGGTFCMSAGTSGAMLPFSHQSGMAAALGGACRFLYAGLVGLFIARHIDSTLPLAVPAVLQSLLGLYLLFLLRRYRNNH